ncbi:hypothetical protein [Actinophytocola sp.]|uniref:hypothetical protein n=1 Tax=Actinophytocola sp. TaxID=1872138 RepID=UPI002EDAA2A5
MRSTLRKGAVTIVGASAILSLALGGTALADPNLDNAGAPLAGGYLPDANDVVGVGSDTTQYVVNSAAQAQSAPTPDVRLASFNATKPGTEKNPGGPTTGDPIAIRPGTTIPRPDGSSAGINALISTPQLDFARSSRARGSAPAEANLYFIPALTDGLSYIVDDTAGADIRNLDATELAAIYRCTDTRGYAPKLPQTGSGTRSFFLGQIGVTDAQVGACVQIVQEHDAAPVNGNPLALAPFSTARFANNPPDPANPPSKIVNIATTAPTAGVFFASRTVFNVVRKADYDAAGSRLPAIFGPSGYLCTRFASGANRQAFSAATNCGALL